MKRHISGFFESGLRLVQQVSSETLKPEKLNQLWQKLRELLNRNKYTIVFDMLQKLRTLQQTQLHTNSPEEQTRIAQRQQELVTQLQEYANQILQTIQNPRLSQTKRDELMGLYGELMDQMSVQIFTDPKFLELSAKLQTEALKNLERYFEQNPQATEIARWIFMLYHHGGGIDPNLVNQAYRLSLQGQPLSTEFAAQYVMAETLAKPYLERYIAAVLNLANFSLDSEEDYQKLLSIITLAKNVPPNGNLTKEISCIVDAANWYRRISYYLRLSQINDPQLDFYSKKTLELHQLLATKLPHFEEQLAKVYEELGIQED